MSFKDSELIHDGIALAPPISLTVPLVESRRLSISLMVYLMYAC